MLSAPVYAKQGENQDSSPLSSLLLQSQSVIGSVLGQLLWLGTSMMYYLGKKFIVIDQVVYKHYLTVI